MLLVSLGRRCLHVFSLPRICFIALGLFLVVMMVGLSFLLGLVTGTYNGFFGFSCDPTIPLLEDTRQYSGRGNRAVPEAAAKGDVALEAIWHRTDGFLNLYGPQPVRVASLLIKVNSPMAQAIAWRMWLQPVGVLEKPIAHDDWGAQKLLATKLAGAYVLARMGVLREKDSQDLFTLLSRDDLCRINDYNYKTSSFLVLAMASAQFVIASELFVKNVSQVITRGGFENFPDVLFEACGIIGDNELILPLRKQLLNWTPQTYDAEEDWQRRRNQTMDFGPRILRSLILLGDYSAIELFIERCLESKATSYEHLECLDRLTGNDNPRTSVEWMAWWKDTGNRFRLSDTALNVLTQETIEFGERSLFQYNTGRMYKNPDFPFNSLKSVRKLGIAE